MQLKEIMTRNVEVIHPNATLEEAAAKMDDLNVGPLPVCDGRRLVGIVTDRDIVVRAISAGQDPKSTRVRDVMTSDVVYEFEDQDVREATRRMKEDQIRRLVVLDSDKNLVGIVSLGDLAVDSGDDGLSGDVLEGVSSPAEPDRS
ncbi:MAG TPA: CBS domain-containing protein [Chloroflexota bacterium]|jgi:CBS domain-containing protein|nr:CBS domain-containing protein [Chloroflexota bacterium]